MRIQRVGKITEKESYNKICFIHVAKNKVMILIVAVVYADGAFDYNKIRQGSRGYAKMTGGEIN